MLPPRVSNVDFSALTKRVPRRNAGAEKSSFVHLPVLLTEYKKSGPGDELFKGINQLRMYLVAAVKFLHAIGVDDFPVFGLFTTGHLGIVLCCVLKVDPTANESGIQNEVRGLLQHHQVDDSACSI